MPAYEDAALLPRHTVKAAMEAFTTLECFCVDIPKRTHRQDMNRRERNADTYARVHVHVSSSGQFTRVLAQPYGKYGNALPLLLLPGLPSHIFRMAAVTAVTMLTVWQC